MAKKKSAAKTSIPVEAIKHADTRKNIPTEELRDFLPDEPPQAKLYPRDVSLDPQLVWKGKDEQDSKSLEVPVVPIYIQEKIHPQAIIEDLKARQPQPDAGPQQLDLFADFNGIDTFDKKVDFYHHDQHWSNRMILGDSLAVMTSLAEKEGLKGQVQTIYFDPPYGIKFGSNWQVSTRKRDVKDGKAEDATRQPEQVRAFRDTWELGIHSYLAYLRDRLTSARDLLTETGSVFVQIGDENVHLVRSVMDEVFGSESFFAQFVVKKKGSQKGEFIEAVNDFILWYGKAAKSEQRTKFRPIYLKNELDSETLDEFRMVEFPDGRCFPISAVPTPDDDTFDYRLSPRRLLSDWPNARLFRSNPLTSGGDRKNQSLPFAFQGRTYHPGQGNCWKTTVQNTDGSRPGMQKLVDVGRLLAGTSTLSFKRYLDDFGYQKLSNWWDGLGGASDPIYVVQTNVELVRRCLLMTTDPGDLVLDPTCGSGTTAYVAEQWGRRWITLDTSRVALALARTRLMAARFPYYLLSDSPEGRKKNWECLPLDCGDSSPLSFLGAAALAEKTERKESGNQLPQSKNLDCGDSSPLSFLSSSAADDPSTEKTKARKESGDESPHSKSDIKRGFVYKRVPHVTLKSIANNPDIKEGMTRQQIDAAIAKHAETELLFDKPYEDSSKVRVTGPFTVESLSPHRRLTVETKKARAAGRDGLSLRTYGPDQFGTMILDNLRKSGIQARDKTERLKFDSLEPFAGEWIHATGEFTDSTGTAKRVAICIGPEHGTVGPELIKEAAKETVKGRGFDLLYILGFAFDPHVDQEIKNFGKLNVQICRMNPDLSMGDELLKKTGAGNLFMVFGEPDIEILECGD